MSFFKAFFTTEPTPPTCDITTIKPLAVPVDDLKSILKQGRLVLPTDSDYQEIRTTWNWDVSGTPSAIALVANETEIADILKFINKHQLKVCISGGKHSHYSSINNALSIDTRLLKNISIDKEQKTATAQAGVKLGEFDAACAPYNMSTTCGTNFDTGLIGLTLGGGLGFLAKSYGMTIDNVLSIKIALLDGRIVNANANENQDLFWALRGGGGNFGVVIEITYQLHDLPKDSIMYAGAMVYLPFGLLSLIQTAPLDAFKLHRDFSLTLPDEMILMTVAAGGGPFIAVYTYNGDPSEGEKLIKSANLGSPIANTLKPIDYHKGVQSLALGKDGKGQSTGYYYEKSVLLDELPDTAVEKIWELTHVDQPSECSIVIFYLGGKFSSVKPDATAFPHRNAKLWVLVMSKFDGTPEQKIKSTEWCRKAVKELEVYGSARYQAVGEIQNDKSESANFFGPNHDRLKKIKQQYDPLNLFSYNQNI
ncbi:hypothetical protein BC833DRAFT_620996 [Globomyces pollinis-pini]|nr:hypothetical protein BC833DRAFT_620996 [Globomyces pollinis-pini]